MGFKIIYYEDNEAPYYCRVTQSKCKKGSLHICSKGEKCFCLIRAEVDKSTIEMNLY